MGLLDETLERAFTDYVPKQYFEEGLHTVKIVGASEKTITTKKGDELETLEIEVTDEGGERSANTLLWFSSKGGVKWSVGVISGLLVHNVDENKKDALREAVKAAYAEAGDNHGKIRAASLELINSGLRGKEGYLLVTPREGSKYPSNELYHYPAKPRQETKELTPDNVKEFFKDAEPVPTSEIPDFKI